MFNGGGEMNQQRQTASFQDIRRQAHVRIVEQPASKATRFRYECERRSAGSIPGATSTPENKTFPSIQVVGYTGRAVVVVSCVTKDPPYKPHPHNLVGREGCKRGVCTLEIPQETMSVTFSNLGVQCVKKKDIESALKIREEIRVDPFRTGFSHRNQPAAIDLNAVRLCFQVFLESERGKFNLPLTPVVSHPIYDKKTMCDLSIVKLSDCVSYVDGGRKDIILLCEKVAKEDIQIRFFEEKDGQLVWEDFGHFKPSQVHKQTAIWFRTPRYRTLEVTEPVKVFIQLRRPSDGVCSEPLPFELLPLDSDPNMLKRKRKKFDDPHEVLRQLQEHGKNNTIPPPYGGQMYGGIGPMYAGNHGLSPTLQYQSPSPVAPSDIQHTLNYQSPQPNFNISPLPPMGGLMQPNWNVQAPQAPVATNMPNNLSASGVCSFFNLDSRELKQLNSTELTSLNTFDEQNLSETFTTNLSLTDVGEGQDQNMSDSITRFANNTIDNILVQ